MQARCSWPYSHGAAEHAKQTKRLAVRGTIDLARAENVQQTEQGNTHIRFCQVPRQLHIHCVCPTPPYPAYQPRRCHAAVRLGLPAAHVGAHDPLGMQA